MLLLLWYLLEITVLSAGVAGFYLLLRKRNSGGQQPVLLFGLAALMVVTVSATVPTAAVWNIPAEPITCWFDATNAPSRADGGHVQPAIAAHHETVSMPAAETAPWIKTIFLCVLIGMIGWRLAVLFVNVILLSRIKSRARTVDDASLLTLLVSQNQARGQRRVHLAGILVQETHELDGVATIGYRRPVILLPAGWQALSTLQLKAILAHELEHIYNRDFASRLFAELVSAVHFYHPLIRWLVKQLRLEQEWKADWMATTQLPMRQYEDLLFALALSRPGKTAVPPATSFSTGSKSNLRSRIELLRLRRFRNKNASPRVGLASVSVLACLTSVLCGLSVSADATGSQTNQHRKSTTDSMSPSASVHHEPAAAKTHMGSQPDSSRHPLRIEFEKFVTIPSVNHPQPPSNSDRPSGTWIWNKTYLFSL